MKKVQAIGHHVNSTDKVQHCALHFKNHQMAFVLNKYLLRILAKFQTIFFLLPRNVNTAFFMRMKTTVNFAQH